MDEKDFKKHLKDLAHGHHHPEEHDWPANGTLWPAAAQPAKPKRAPAKKAARKTTRRAKKSAG